jgi:hypothetical protein
MQRLFGCTTALFRCGVNDICLRPDCKRCHSEAGMGDVDRN